MGVLKLSADVKLKRTPSSGSEAYVLLIDSLKEEIEERKKILSELASEEVKRKFVREWSPKTKSVNIRG